MTTYQILTLLGGSTIVVSFLGFIVRYMIKMAKSVKALCKGVQAVLRAQMVDDYNRYSEKGYAPIYAKENFENCWVQYEALGANGVMSDIHAKFMALPDKREREDKK